MKSETSDHGTLETWTPEEVQKAQDAKTIVLIDMRTPAEFTFEHIPGALLAPMHAFSPSNMPGQGEKQIVFHCGSGARSRKVAEMCLKAGFDKIAHMEGGFGAWKEAGLDYSGTDMSTGAPKGMRKSS
ncbi:MULTISPECIES: rhodanese-like domain-containing protein [unclassified Marinovum]